MERSADDILPTAPGIAKSPWQDADWRQGCHASGDPEDRQRCFCTGGAISSRGRAWRVAADT